METDKGCGARNFSEFDSMTTEQLQDILRVDLLIPDEESDAELILHIVEVIAEREAHIHYPGTSSPEASWERFKARHLSDPDRPGEPEPQPNTCSVIQPGRRRAARRAASIAAIFAGVIILGSAGAYAAGIDIFQAIANWTQDTFYFAGTGGTGITMCFSVPAYAMVDRANPIISYKNDSISSSGEGILISFTVFCKDVCTTLGASTVELYKEDATFLKRYSSSAYAYMLSSNTDIYSATLSYPGSPGESYYAVMTFYAEYEGSSYTASYTTAVGP